MPGCKAYGVGGIAIGTLSAAPAVLMLYYMTQLLGLPPLWASFILIAPKGAALLWDPLLGRTLDRLGQSAPPRLLFYALGAVTAPLALALALAAPPLPPAMLALYVGVTYTLHVAGYSILSIGHVAATAALPAGEAERMRWSAARTRFVLGGIVAGAGLAPLMLGMLGGGRNAQAIVGVAIALLCLVTALVPLVGARRALSTATSPSAHRRLPAELLRLFLAYLAITTANGVGSAAVPLWVGQWLGRSASDAGILLLILLIAATLVIPYWRMLGTRLPPHRALTVAIAAHVTVLLVLCLLIVTRVWAAMIGGFVLLGITFGGLQVLPFALIAASIRRHAEKGGAGEGAAIGIWAAIEKLSLGTGPALTGMALAASGGHADLVFVVAVTMMAAALLVGAALAVSRQPGMQHMQPA